MASLFKVYELFLQQKFEDEFSILLGLHDLNAEFYVTDSSTLFFNSSFGIGKDVSQATSGNVGPSIFPSTSIAFRVKTENSKKFYMQFAAFNAIPTTDASTSAFRFNLNDGLFLITEMAFLRGQEEKSADRPAKYGIGVWSYTSQFDHLTALDSGTSAQKATAYGGYALIDQTLSDDVSAFARFGLASPQTLQFVTALGAGVVFSGALLGREHDKFGLGLAMVTNGAQYKQANATMGTSETTLEFNYRFRVYRGIHIQPDLQYVMNPSTDPNIRNAFVAAARAEISL